MTKKIPGLFIKFADLINLFYVSLLFHKKFLKQPNIEKYNDEVPKCTH